MLVPGDDMQRILQQRRDENRAQHGYHPVANNVFALFIPQC